MIKEAIGKVVGGTDLSREEAAQSMSAVMSGEATPAQIAAFVTALHMKGETVDEITGCAETMREKAASVNCSKRPLIDTCGTGGDGSGTFNISTAAAIVAAAAGATVAKHGNRAASSRCGSADVLEELGVRIDLAPDKVETCLEQAGIGFMFAPVFHQSMKHAAGPRRELGIRTIFNMVGPVTNPAGADSQVMGIFSAELTEPMASVLGNLGAKRAFVVHGSDGLDEVTITGPTQVSELRDGEVKTYTVTPEEIGVGTGSKDDLKGGDVRTNATIIMDVLHGEKGPPREIVLANAGACLAVAGLVSDFREGAALARDTIDSGRAIDKLEQFRKVSQS
jgi:anthranilate phosphoribosyltransferase